MRTPFSPLAARRVRCCTTICGRLCWSGTAMVVVGTVFIRGFSILHSIAVFGRGYARPIEPKPRAKSSGSSAICGRAFMCRLPAGWLSSTLLLLLGAQLDIHSTAAIRPGRVERSSPEAAKRCAAGAGLDGDEASRATIDRAVIGALL